MQTPFERFSLKQNINDINPIWEDEVFYPYNAELEQTIENNKKLEKNIHILKTFFDKILLKPDEWDGNSVIKRQNARLLINNIKEKKIKKLISKGEQHTAVKIEGSIQRFNLIKKTEILKYKLYINTPQKNRDYIFTYTEIRNTDSNQLTKRTLIVEEYDRKKAKNLNIYKYVLTKNEDLKVYKKINNIWTANEQKKIKNARLIGLSLEKMHKGIETLEYTQKLFKMLESASKQKK